ISSPPLYKSSQDLLLPNGYLLIGEFSLTIYHLQDVFASKIDCQMDGTTCKRLNISFSFSLYYTHFMVCVNSHVGWVERK
ncbi:MAG: hypothetical protein AAB422_04780, partial [Planctomycetota bacterium]